MNPKNQTTETIVASLLSNTKRQYTEAAHAEIFRLLYNTLEVLVIKGVIMLPKNPANDQYPEIL